MRVLLVSMLVGLCWPSSVAAQPSATDVRAFGRYQQLHWSERDGLPQNTVLAIAATRDGYLWLGTYEGAVRFDGVRFTLFNPSNTAGLGNALVMALCETADGSLWFATYGGGVSRLADGRFTRFGTDEGLRSDFATSLYEDRHGTLWVGTDGGGVAAFERGRFLPITVEQGLPSNLVRSVIGDGRGGLYVGTDGGVAHVTDNRVGVLDASPEASRADVSTLALAADGSLWIAGLRGGLYRVDAQGTTSFGASHGLPAGRVESLVRGEDGRMWLGTAGGVFRDDGDRFIGYTAGDGLPGGRVPAIARATEGGMWVGTDGGLVRLTTPRFSTYSLREGLPSSLANNIYQDGDENVWVDADGRLARFRNGAFQTVGAAESLPGGPVRLALSHVDRHPLVHTATGLWRWRGTRFVPVGTPSGIPWDRATAVLEDRAGTLWVGVHDDGLYQVRAGRVVHLTRRDGLADDSVLSLFEDDDRGLWVGTLRKGVTRIDGDELTSWSVRDGLAADHVKTFYQGADGAVWIGTHGGGLSRYKDGRFATVSTRQGLYNDTIFVILEGADGELWMSANTGIWRTSLRQLNEVADGTRASVESFAYGVADGMPTSETVGSSLAGARLTDGMLWFPTAKGIVAVDPRRRDGDAPRVRVERVSIDQAAQPLGPEVQLTPGQEHLEIEYTGLNWHRPQAIRFKYRLTGLDRDWVDAGSRRTAYYSHLPPGRYAFTVIADNGEGVWNTVGSTLAVTVQPRVHQTVWFRGAVIAGLMAATWLFWRSRMTRMRRAQAAQQAFSRQLIASEERERQRIAAELHDSLGQSLLVVKNRAAMGALAEPEGTARRQFDEIGATVAQTLDEVRTIAYNLRPHHLDQLGLTTTIRAMLDRVGESAGLRIAADLDDVDGAFPPEQEITIYRIIQESVNNIVKHAQATEAQVTMRSLEDRVAITVRDNGRGFDPGAPRATDDPSAGFGLRGLAERVTMLGGIHAVDTAPGRGTTVRVVLGLGTGRATPAWLPTSAS